MTTIDDISSPIQSATSAPSLDSFSSPIQPPTQPQDWRAAATSHIQSLGLHSDQPADAHTMIAIYDAYRRNFGTPQEQAQPDFGQQMGQDQQQAQQQQNDAHGQLASAAIEALHPAGGLFARGEQALAPVADALFGSADPNVGNRMRAHAQTLLNTRGNTSSVGGTVGNFVGNLPVMANPLVAGASAASETSNEIDQQRAAGADISQGNAGLDIAGHAILNAAMSYLLQGNTQGGAAKALEGKLAPYVNQYVARYGARGAVGALIGAGQQFAGNVTTGATVNPNQSLTEGLGKAAAFGGGTEVAFTGAEDFAKQFKQPAPPSEPTPAAPPAETPQVTQAETPAQNGEQAPDLNGPFSAEDMQKYIALKSEDADMEGARQLLGDKQYEKRDVPIDQLSPRGNTENKQGQIDQYAQQPADTAPPVVSDGDGQIIDGNRRLMAAKARGDTTVPAYVPTDSVLGQQGEEQTPKQPGLFNRFLSEESGGTTVPKKVMDRLSEWMTGSIAQKRSTATAQFDTAQAVSQLKPFEDAGEKLTPDERIAWVDAVDKGAVSTGHTDLDGAIGPLQDLNRATIQRAADLGIDTDKFRESYIGFMAKKPEGMSPEVYQSKLQGTENYLKGRTSPTFSDYVDAIQKKGLDLAYENPVQMIMAKNAEINKSLSWREELSEAKDRGDALSIAKDDDVPEGYMPLPGRLATDPIVNDDPDNVLVVKKGFGQAIENADENAKSGKGIWSKILNAGRGIRYAVDTYYAGRSIAGAIGHGMGEALGGNFGGFNLKRQFQMGKAAISGDLFTDPGLEPARQALETAMKEGNFTSSALPKAPPMNEPTVLGKVKAGARAVSDFIQKGLVQPLKIGAIIQQAEYAKSQGWNPDQSREYLSQATRIINNMYGGDTGPKTLPPVMQGAMNILMPTVHYRTAGVRTVGEGIFNLLQGRFKESPAAKSAVGSLLAAAAMGITHQMITTKINTGTSQMPKTVNDLFFPRTGEKNADGTDKRVMITSAVAPMAEAVEQIHKSGVPAALKSMIDPAVFSTAEAIENRDYRGGVIGDTGDRILHAAKGFAPVLPSDQEGFQLKDTGNYAAQLAGIRPAPKLISRSPAEQALFDLNTGATSVEEAGRHQLVAKLATRVRGGDDSAWDDASDALQRGDLTRADLSTIKERAKAPTGIAGSIQLSSASPKDLMSVWTKMSPEEKDQAQAVMRKKVGGSKAITPEERENYLDQIDKDTP